MFTGRAPTASRLLSLLLRPPVPFGAGQPLFETRPHYIQPQNLTPNILAQEYCDRRLRLARSLPDRSLAIVIGNQIKYASGSVFYPFQQNNDLYYLLGWLEPNSVIIIEKNGSALVEEGGVALHMLVPPSDPKSELWEGAKLGVDGAQSFFNADYAEPVSNARRYLDFLLSRNRHVYWDSAEPIGGAPQVFRTFFGSKDVNELVPSVTDLISKSPAQKRPLAPLMSQMRLVKSDAEIRVMHAAARMSGRAINLAMAAVGSLRPFSTEKTLAKFLEYGFVRGGCDAQAYVPVVASGANALNIHYTRNDDLLYRDETVFVDAGGKLGGYCADISRAWPNSPRGFLEAQRDIYSVVLATNKRCIDMCSADQGHSLHDIHTFSVKCLWRELKNLPGFRGLEELQVLTLLYPHYVGHYLGLDLHDVPRELTHQPLRAKTVVTIEPGLYIPQDDKWPKQFRGIGMRVEDDIVVGERRADIVNLSSGCVKEVADIEALVRGGKVTTPGITDEVVMLDF